MGFLYLSALEEGDRLDLDRIQKELAERDGKHVPRHFSYVKLRSKVGGGKGMEIDVEGGAGKERWIYESKWWIGRKVGQAEVKSLMQKGNAVKEEVGEGLRIWRLWFFANDGLTVDAEALMLKNGVLWSVGEDFDGLLKSVGLRQLPKLAGDKINYRN